MPMIVSIVIGLLFLVAGIACLTVGLPQTENLMSIFFYILASGALVKLLFIFNPAQKEKVPKNSKSRPEDEKSSPPPAADFRGAELNASRIIHSADTVLKDIPVAAAHRNPPRPRSPVQNLGTFDVNDPSLSRAYGHPITLRPSQDGLFSAKLDINTNIVYLTLKDPPVEGAWADLSRYGIQQLFILLDENGRETALDPSYRRVVLSSGETAQCRCYDNQLALVTKGTVYVSRSR